MNSSISKNNKNIRSVYGFPNYLITKEGKVLNKNGIEISVVLFKNTKYVRLYKNGKRHTFSIQKLLVDSFSSPLSSIKLLKGERIFRYENSNYYITSFYRVFNSKTNRFIKVQIRNNYPVAHLSIEGCVFKVSLLKFLKSKGGVAYDKQCI